MARNKIETEVKRFIQIIKNKYHAQVIMFGSRVRGDFLKSSDYDFVVISEYFRDIHPHDRIFMVLKQWNLPYNLDVLVYTPEEFRKKSEMLTTVRIIKREGIEV